MNCPRCKTDSLKTEDYEGISIERCRSCSGTWLDNQELGKILAIKEKTFSPEFIKSTIKSAFEGLSHAAVKTEELLCPSCNFALKAVNFHYASGVIIDRCVICDGIWLDKDELEKVQVYFESAESKLDGRTTNQVSNSMLKSGAQAQATAMQIENDFKFKNSIFAFLQRLF